MPSINYRGTVEERFWRRVDVRDFNGCWIWTGAITKEGYGAAVAANRKTVPAHRLAWELLVGPIPDGYSIDHDNIRFGCGNPACVCPDHLEAVPQQLNKQRGRYLKVDNKSGHRGVSWCKKNEKWYVSAKLNGKSYNGGLYVSIDDAVAARDALHIRLFGQVMNGKERFGGTTQHRHGRRVFLR